jgi:hypothetical protein
LNVNCTFLLKPSPVLFPLLFSSFGLGANELETG